LLDHDENELVEIYGAIVVLIYFSDHLFDLFVGSLLAEVEHHIFELVYVERTGLFSIENVEDFSISG
jgi:hypothetical protein